MPNQYRFSGTVKRNSLDNIEILKSIASNALSGKGLNVDYLAFGEQSRTLTSITYGVTLGVTENNTIYGLTVSEKVLGALRTVFNSVTVQLDSIYNTTTRTFNTGNTSTPSTSGNIYNLPYIVKAGDTLSKIGASLKINWQDIAKWNDIKSPYIIEIGQKLVINGVTQASTTPVITGTNTNGTVQVTNTQLPEKPKEKSFLDSLSESLGIAPYIIGVGGFAILLILVVPRGKK